MNFTMQLFVDDVRRVMWLFLICGLFVYAIDYKELKKKPGFGRPATFSKIVAMVYIFGSLSVFVGATVFDLIL